jgi:hypothetical protein
MLRPKAEQADKGREITNPEQSQTLTDEQIVTERKVARSRRSFLTVAGTLLAGGALAFAAGHAAAQDQDSDAAKSGQKDSDADKKKTKTKKSKKEKGEKASDPDKGKGENPAPPQQ